MIRVDIKPELLSWARERAGLETDALEHRFPKLAAREQGTVTPTLKQVEDFAKAMHTPVGFLFLQQPPVEEIPIRRIEFSIISEKSLHTRMVDSVERILAAKKQWAAATTEGDRSRLDTLCTALDREIDTLVYALYGLTAAEIKLVESASVKTSARHGSAKR